MFIVLKLFQNLLILAEFILEILLEKIIRFVHDFCDILGVILTA